MPTNNVHLLTRKVNDMKNGTETPRYNQDPDRLMNEVEAAQILGYTIRCLQNWRLRGGGPRFVKVSSRSIRYRRRDLNEWIESKLATSTSEMCNG